MKRFFLGSNDVYEIKDCSIDRLDVVCNFLAAAVNTRITKSDFDAKKVYIDVERWVKGDRKVIIRATLYQLIIRAEVDHINAAQIIGSGDWVGSQVSVAEDTSVKQLVEAKVPIDLPTLNVLKGDDKIVVRVNVASDAWGGDVDTTQASFISVDEVKAVGEEASIGILEITPIQENQSVVRINAGDFVSRMYFANQDVSDYDIVATQPLQSVNISSDKYDETLDLNTLKQRRDVYMQKTGRSGSVLNASHILHPELPIGVMLNDVVLEVFLNQTNINASENFIYVEREVLILEHYVEGVRRAEKHREENTILVE